MPGKPAFNPSEDLEKRQNPFLATLNTSGFLVQSLSSASSRMQMQVCILGTSRLGRCVVGFQPFILGVDKLGEGTLY